MDIIQVMGIGVCHVVNTLDSTIMPSDLAVRQAKLDQFDNVGILSWFDINFTPEQGNITTECLDVPDNLYITPSQYQKAKSFFSDYDIIHTHRPHSGFYSKLIAKRLGKSVIHTEHNNHRGYTNKGLVANGLTNSLADVVVCVSDSVRKSFRGWERALLSDTVVSVIPNGVDIGHIEAAADRDWSVYDVADIDSDAVLVGSAGMLTEQKAHEVLVEAVDRANDESERPIELVISGDGELRENLKEQVNRATHSDRLHLLGFLDEREQVYRMMAELDIYAMPSRWEGFCVAALEGLALGKPCLFSDIPEFTEPFGDVARFHAVDDPADLVTELLTLADDEQARQELGAAARELVRERYTLEVTTRRYLDHYTEII